MVRMPGFGLAGPWRDYVGWALNIEQLSGMSACTGYPDGPPCNLQGPADPIAGVHAAVALLAALEHRRRTGEGQLIEVAQIEVGAAVTAEPVIEYSLTGNSPRPREGNRHRELRAGCLSDQRSGRVGGALGARRFGLGRRRRGHRIALTCGMTRDSHRRSPAGKSRRIRRDACRLDWQAHRRRGRRASSSSEGVPAERLLTADRMYDVDAARRARLLPGVGASNHRPTSVPRLAISDCAGSCAPPPDAVPDARTAQRRGAASRLGLSDEDIADTA